MFFRKRKNKESKDYITHIKRFSDHLEVHYASGKVIKSREVNIGGDIISCERTE